MKLETFELSGATVEGVHLNLRGWLYHRTETTGRTSWDGTATVDAFPKPLHALGSNAVDVIFEATPRNIRGQAHLTFGATVNAQGPTFPIRISGTGELEDA